MTKRQTPSPVKQHSPWVTADFVAGRTTQLAEIRTSADTIYWLETRAANGGKTTLVAQKNAFPPRDVTTPDVNVRSSVNEYGGGAYAVSAEGRVIFTNAVDGRIYHIPDGVQKVMGGTDNCRYADFSPLSAAQAALCPSAPEAVFCIREDHRAGGQAETSIVWVAAGIETVLVRGQDFYASPRLSPNGQYLAFVSWDHPNMPWNETQLKLVRLDWAAGHPAIAGIRVLVGEDAACSVMEPVWQDQTTLFALSDANGTWQPVKFEKKENWAGAFLPDSGFEIGAPPWVFGHQSLICLRDGGLLTHGVKNGMPHVASFNEDGWRDAHFGFSAAVPLPIGDAFAWLHTPSDAPPSIRIGRDLAQSRVLQTAFTFPDGIGPDDCAHPRALSFPTRDGATAHGFFYAPVDDTALADAAGRPPLIVTAHGGPTAAANPAFSFKVQWWTTRGFALLDVNYRGSSGWGRAYRQALEGEWGARDVTDCIDAVRYICDQGLADPKRCVIRGGSSGGLTVLQCLALSDIFCAGTSLYGVADLMTLVAETHKFESRYLDRLIGPLPATRHLYTSRSPVHHAAQINVPVLFLHGDADQVVPLAQAEEMYQRLKDHGVTTEIKIYPGEGHGFRQAETLRDSFQREYDFYLSVFRGVA
ncbi:Acylaminoacyl-peptidase [Acetobacteraceae bacterium EV16G]